MKYTFTIDTDNLNDVDNPEEAVKDLQLLFKVLINSNPNYYLIGGMLNEQLEQQLKQANPKQQMIAKWDELWFKVTGYSTKYTEVTSSHISNELKQKIKDFYDQIGEAMGPICYAGYQVYTSTDDTDIGIWIESCIKYYEEHWRL